LILILLVDDDHGGHKHHKFKGKTGNVWEIPYAVAPQVKGLSFPFLISSSDFECCFALVSDSRLYTVVFGSRTLARCRRDEGFKTTLVLAALEIVEENFSEQISRDGKHYSSSSGKIKYSL